jgi:hypothetical protein
MNGRFQMQGGKTGFCRKRSMQTGSCETLIGHKSGQTTNVPLWDRMEGSWLRTLDFAESDHCKPVLLGLSLAINLVKPLMSPYGDRME